jgi:hypothetical protein
MKEGNKKGVRRKGRERQKKERKKKRKEISFLILHILHF